MGQSGKDGAPLARVSAGKKGIAWRSRAVVATVKVERLSSAGCAGPWALGAGFRDYHPFDGGQ